MASVAQIMDAVALTLFQNIREGMQTGRIADMNATQAEIEAAITELNRRRLPDERTFFDIELVGQLLLDIGSLHEKVAKCEEQLAEFEHQAKVLKEDAAQAVARAEACNLLVEQQQKENATIPDTIAAEGVKPTMPTAMLAPPCVTPAPSPVNLGRYPVPSRVAIVSFPGGPRTITIHPPDSPSYESVIHDEKGDVIIDFKHTRSLRREGAFRGPLEDIDWFKITHVHGRGPELPGVHVAPSVPRWPDRSQPSSAPPTFRGPSDIIARQRQLSLSMQTDPFGRVLPWEYEYLSNAARHSGTTLISPEPSQDSQPSSSEKLEIFTTPPSSPPSPSVRRGTKRVREGEDDGDALLPGETHEGGSRSTERQIIQEPTTPTPVKHEELDPSEGPTKRKKPRSSASLEVLSSRSISRTRSSLDLTRTI